ncbi:MAG: hypothetical protein PF501_18195 [Salinisphaera sp.]|nr:hypothetical protein [Salinisphaera sp.]
MRKKWIVACVLAALTLPAMAAGGGGQRNILGIEKAALGDSFPADRPSFGEAIGVIPKGHYELEGGFRQPRWRQHLHRA